MSDANTTHKIIESFEVAGDDAVNQAFARLALLSSEAARAVGLTHKQFGKLSQGASVVADRVTEMAETFALPGLDGLAGDANSADAAFAKLDRGLGSTDDKLDAVAKASKKAATAVKHVGDDGAPATSKLSELFGSLKGKILGGLAAIYLLDKAVAAVSATFRYFAHRATEVDRTFEAAGSRIQGTLLGLIDFGKGASEIERINISARGAAAIFDQLRDISKNTASELADVEEEYTRISSVVSGLGKSQYDVLRLTEMATGAAKVYGAAAAEAGNVVSKAVAEGVVEGESAFAKAFKAQAQLTGQKMPVEERVARVSRVLAAMSSGVSVVTRDTAGAFSRLNSTVDDVLQGLTSPFYDRVGQLVQYFVDSIGDSKALGESLALGVEKIIAPLSTVWDIAASINDTLGVTDKIGALLSATWDSVKTSIELVLDPLDLFLSYVRLGYEAIHSALNPDDGLAKFYAISESLELKWSELGDTIMRAVRAVFSFARALPLVGDSDFMNDFMGEFDRALEKGDAERAKMATHLRELEQRAGIGPLTDTTRALERAERGRGLEEGARRGVLESLKGLLAGKPLIQQNISQVNLRQQIEATDAHELLFEFARSLEKLGEAPLQSPGGIADSYAFGSAY